MEMGHIRSQGKIDAQLVLMSRGLIVLRDPLPHLTGGDAHNGIGVGVVIAWTAEDLCAEISFFEDLDIVLNGAFDDESEEGGVTFTVPEVGAGYDPFQLLQKLFPSQPVVLKGLHFIHYMWRHRQAYLSQVAPISTQMGL